MKLVTPAERFKESRLHSISREIDELAALARMSLYIAEELCTHSPLSAKAALELLRSIETDLAAIHSKGASVRKGLN